MLRHTLSAASNPAGNLQEDLREPKSCTSRAASDDFSITGHLGTSIDTAEQCKRSSLAASTYHPALSRSKVASPQWAPHAQASPLQSPTRPSADVGLDDTFDAALSRQKAATAHLESLTLSRAQVIQALHAATFVIPISSRNSHLSGDVSRRKFASVQCSELLPFHHAPRRHLGTNGMSASEAHHRAASLSPRASVASILHRMASRSTSKPSSHRSSTESAASDGSATRLVSSKHAHYSRQPVLSRSQPVLETKNTPIRQDGLSMRHSEAASSSQVQSNKGAPEEREP